MTSFIPRLETLDGGRWPLKGIRRERAEAQIPFLLNRDTLHLKTGRSVQLSLRPHSPQLRLESARRTITLLTLPLLQRGSCCHRSATRCSSRTAAQESLLLAVMPASKGEVGSCDLRNAQDTASMWDRGQCKAIVTDSCHQRMPQDNLLSGLRYLKQIICTVAPYKPTRSWTSYRPLGANSRLTLAGSGWPPIASIQSSGQSSLSTS